MTWPRKITTSDVLDLNREGHNDKQSRPTGRKLDNYGKLPRKESVGNATDCEKQNEA